MPWSATHGVICPLFPESTLDTFAMHLINLAHWSNITHTLIRSLCSSSLGKMVGLRPCSDENTEVIL